MRVITPNIPEAELFGAADRPAVATSRRGPGLVLRGRVSVFPEGGGTSPTRSHRHFLQCRDGRGYSVAFAAGSDGQHARHGLYAVVGATAFLPRGFELSEAAARSEGVIASAIEAGASYEIGHGHGPVHHFHDFWE